MGSSQDFYTIMDQNTDGYIEHIYCQHTYKHQEPTDINVLQLRIVTNIFRFLRYRY